MEFYRLQRCFCPLASDGWCPWNAQNLLLGTPTQWVETSWGGGHGVCHLHVCVAESPGEALLELLHSDVHVSDVAEAWRHGWRREPSVFRVACGHVSVPQTLWQG